MLKNFKKKKNNKGFTLVELLVVIAIIGVLAVVAVPTLFKQIDKSKGADISATASTIKTATTTYYADKGTIPTAIEGSTQTTLQGAGYLDSNPNIDKDKVEYTMTVNATNKTAKLDIKIIGNYMDGDSIATLAKDLGVTVGVGNVLTVPLVGVYIAPPSN